MCILKEKKGKMLTHRSFFEPTKKISGNVVEFCSKASSSHCLRITQEEVETFNGRAFIKKKQKTRKQTHKTTTTTTESKENYFTLYCRGT